MIGSQKPACSAYQPKQNAGPQANSGAISGVAGPTIGSTTIPAAQAAELPNQPWHIDIHKDSYAGG